MWHRSWYTAVHIRIPLRCMLMSRWRAIVCSQCEQACEQAHACSIAPSGTACRNAQIQVSYYISVDVSDTSALIFYN